MTEEEKDIIAKYLVSKFEKALGYGTLSQADNTARLFYDLLIELGKKQEAEEVYNLYQRLV